ncbi:KTSC domain-containing protein [Fulvivirga sp. 29W222]|uniref:KTSC domain-containing protein n=1 Tax=Fulvivirga marina TaxID=2494733 RepID=A0A937FWE2_9BACT|nr:KTSC domain-containing protein [Fulvivirga marina]MBL6447385.1 KTSC domain-containing protein [Fulvivirga marina]
MKRKLVNSSVIASIGYDNANELLEMEFSESVDIYQYYNVELPV